MLVVGFYCYCMIGEVLKNIKHKWTKFTGELTLFQKIGLYGVLGTGVFIALAFALLFILLIQKGKMLPILQSQGDILLQENDAYPLKRESLMLPKGYVIEDVMILEKENIVFRVKNNKKEYLYFYKDKKEFPNRIIEVKYQ